MSTVTGRIAETIAADYLEENGHTVLCRNWRTRWCEIDIVTQKAGTIYFVEVKYRARDDWGSGLEAITLQKQRHMHFAAELWMARASQDADYRLSALSLTGTPPCVAYWVEDIGG